MQTKLKIEDAEFGNRETVRANSTKVEEIVRIDIDNVIVYQDFNAREDFDDIEDLANQIEAIGQSTPARVDILKDGTFALTDGERRLRALRILAKRTGQPVYLKAIVNTSKATLQDRILQLFSTQDNKPLKPFEIANVFVKLKNLGNSQKDIARLTGKPDSYVSQMLSFSREAAPVKAAVKEGKMTVGAALALKKQMPKEADRVAAVERAVQDGGKATVSRATGESSKERTAKKIASVIKIRHDAKGIESKEDYYLLILAEL